MRDVLRKWTPREKYVKYQNFPTQFGLLLSLECSGEISRKSVESAYPINSLKVDVFLLKSYARFSLVKVPNQLAPHQVIITPDEQLVLQNLPRNMLIANIDTISFLSCASRVTEQLLKNLKNDDLSRKDAKQNKHGRKRKKKWKGKHLELSISVCHF